MVVDASVVVKWFIEEPGSDRAADLLDQARAGHLALHAPELCVSEVANTIWKLVTHRLVLGRPEGHAVVHALGQLPLVSARTAHLIRRAYAVAVETGLTVYDALYITLAELQKCEMVTADRRLVGKIEGTAWKERVTIL